MCRGNCAAAAEFSLTLKLFFFDKNTVRFLHRGKILERILALQDIVMKDCCRKSLRNGHLRFTLLFASKGSTIKDVCMEGRSGVWHKQTTGRGFSECGGLQCIAMYGT